MGCAADNHNLRPKKNCCVALKLGRDFSFFFSIQTSIFTVNLLQNLLFLAQDRSV